MERRTERFTFENPGAVAIEVWLEPSGMVLNVLPGERIDVTCASPANGSVEVETHPEGHVAVYAWKGASFSVAQNSAEIYSDQGLPELPLLPNLSMRQTLEVLFGSFDDRRQMRASPPPPKQPLPLP